MSSDIFHPFPLVPIELRLKTWRFAFSSPRMVRLEWKAFDGLWVATRQARERYHWSLLLASKESREMFLKEWLPLFRYPASPWYPTQTCYFNPAIDVLHIDQKRKSHLPDRSLESLETMGALSQVKSLFYTSKSLSRPTLMYWPIDQELKFLLPGLPSLKHFLCASRDDRELPWDIHEATLETRPVSAEVLGLGPTELEWKGFAGRHFCEAHESRQRVHLGLEKLRSEDPPVFLQNFILKDAWQDKDSYLLHYVTEERQATGV